MLKDLVLFKKDVLVPNQPGLSQPKFASLFHQLLLRTNCGRGSIPLAPSQHLSKKVSSCYFFSKKKKMHSARILTLALQGLPAHGFAASLSVFCYLKS